MQTERFSPLNDQIMRLRRESGRREETRLTSPLSPLTHRQKSREDSEQTEVESRSSSYGERRGTEEEEEEEEEEGSETEEVDSPSLLPTPTEPFSPSFFPSNRPVACGWMKKRGWINKAWKRRYFLLLPDVEGQGPALFYFISPSMAIRMYKHGEPSHRGFLRLRELKKVALKEVTRSSSSSLFSETRHTIHEPTFLRDSPDGIESADSEEPFDEDRYVIEIHTRDRVWEFSPPSRAELNQWLALLAEAWEAGRVTEPPVGAPLSVHNAQSAFCISEGARKGFPDHHPVELGHASSELQVKEEEL
jgi:hypothetical protein